MEHSTGIFYEPTVQVLDCMVVVQVRLNRKYEHVTRSILVLHNHPVLIERLFCVSTLRDTKEMRRISFLKESILLWGDWNNKTRVTGTPGAGHSERLEGPCREGKQVKLCCVRNGEDCGTREPEFGPPHPCSPLLGLSKFLRTRQPVSNFQVI